MDIRELELIKPYVDALVADGYQTNEAEICDLAQLLKDDFVIVIYSQWRRIAVDISNSEMVIKLPVNLYDNPPIDIFMRLVADACKIIFA